MIIMRDVEEWWVENHNTENCPMCNTFSNGVCTVENHGADDNTWSWDDFITNMIQPFLDEMKAIHEKLPMNSHIPIYDVDGGVILTQRQALQQIIMNAHDMIQCPDLEEGELPVAFTSLLKKEWI